MPTPDARVSPARPGLAPAAPARGVPAPGSLKRPQVAIFGGGVGGLTAAHELCERGFAVTVYEQRDRLGGKSRSMPVEKTAASGKRALPGEHGFRFVPGFYRHLPDTMSRIPYTHADGTVGSVVDNLVRTTMFSFARSGEAELVFPTHVPRNLQELVQVLQMGNPLELGLTPGDIAFFTQKMLVLMSSCDERRFGEWEKLPWWNFVEGDKRSQAFQRYLGRGLTRSLVAMKADIGSTRTVGYVLLQLLFSMVEPGNELDRLLNGPTNDVWIDPWVADLRSKGVQFKQGSLQALQLQGRRLGGATVVQNGTPATVKADHYIAAVPVEVFRDLVTPAMAQVAPELGVLGNLRTDWMNGLQYYVDQETPGVHGHTIYIDSPWALTSVSQKQFWKDVNLADYGDGNVKDIVSVDISAWEVPGVLFGKAARDCTRQEIQQEVLAQMERSANGGIDGAQVRFWHLDPGIVTEPAKQARNTEPLLVNTADSWKDRPEAQTGIANLALAADYVRTNTDLATMESANEAGRRAANAILDATGSRATRAQVFQQREPEAFQPLRWLDTVLWHMGQPNLFETLPGPWSLFR